MRIQDLQLHRLQQPSSKEIATTRRRLCEKCGRETEFLFFGNYVRTTIRRGKSFIKETKGWLCQRCRPASNLEVEESWARAGSLGAGRSASSASKLLSASFCKASAAATRFS